MTNGTDMDTPRELTLNEQSARLMTAYDPGEFRHGRLPPRSI